ncbi:unnamed protein product [Rotaria sordida]|nr:unnamed protein product [Rotaria sordida]
MSRFRQITYHATSQTVDLGAGLLWDDVYQALDPLGVTVVGGQISGVGIAGLILGGGYSRKSNQYGLSIDNAIEYELVSPDARIVCVNNMSYPDIFFGLKGGLNNFGIVTRFTMRAVPQTELLPANAFSSLRSRLSTVSITRFSINLLQAINNQLLYYNSTLGSKPGAWFQITVEPFLPTYFDNSQGGAYPHVPSSTPLLPMNIQFAWALPSDDNVFIDGIKSVTKAIRQAALADCQDVGGSKEILYPNYALEDTPLEQITRSRKPNDILSMQETETTSMETTYMETQQLHSSQKEAMKKIAEFSGEANELDIDEWLFDLNNLFSLMK